MSRALDLVGVCNCEGLERNPAFAAGRLQNWSAPWWNFPVRFSGQIEIQSGSTFCGLVCHGKPGWWPAGHL